MSRRGSLFAAIFVLVFAVAGPAATAMPVSQSTFHFEQVSYTTHEGDGQLAIRIIREGSTNISTSVFVSPVCCTNTAGYGGDYWFANSQFNSVVLVNFAANETFKDLIVVVADDSFFEGTEVAQIGFSSAQTSAPDTTTISIIDNDTSQNSVAFDTSSYSAVERDGSVNIGVTRTGDLSAQATVLYNTANGSAVAPGDYQATSGTLTFAAGESHKTITIPLVDDTIAEGLEFFNLQLTNPTGTSLGAINTTSVLIVDDDSGAQIGFTTSSYIVSENAGSATITITRTGSTSAQASVQYETTSGFCCGNAATPTVDFTPVAGTLTFGPGETVKTFTVPIIDDQIDEQSEGVGLRLLSPVNTTISFSQATLTIVDDDAPTTIGFTQSALVLSEGDGAAVLTVVRNGDVSQTSTVNYVTSDSTARAGSDYALTGGTLTFLPGETNKTISVPIIDDSVAEVTESFTLFLSNATNATVPTNNVAITIVDNDGGGTFVGFDQSSYTFGEGAGTVNLNVRRTGNTGSAFTVDYSLCCGSATPDVDYVNAAGTLSFAPGEVVKSIPLKILQDTLPESTETTSLSLSNAVGASITIGNATISIVDDDQTSQQYSFSPASVTVSEDAGNAVLTVVRSDTSSAENLRYATSNSFSAGAGLDYVPADGLLSFAAGESRKSISIVLIDDKIAEGTENFFVSLISASGVQVALATVTIQDDDVVSLNVSDVSVIEGNDGTRTATFTITPTGSSQSGVGVFYSTVDETAKAGSDYVATSGSLSWGIGDTAPRTVAVTINGDKEPEDDETFLLKLTGVAFGKTAGRATIVNDDAALSVSSSSVVPEGNSGTKDAAFTVTLSPAQSNPVTVGYTTTPGTAGEADYVPTAGTLTFAPGETKKSVTVAVSGDTVPEANETFHLILTTATGATIVHGNATATIIDDDDPFRVEHDIEYAVADGVSLKLDLYTPNTGTGPYPLVIWIHGDHWQGGGRAPAAAVREATRGYAVASIDVRSTDVDIFPAQINDAKAAVRYLRANAARYNLDATRFAAWGFGSGGHIASLLGTGGEVDSLSDPSEGNPAISSRVQAVVSWAAPYDLMQLQNDALACSTTNHNSSGSYTSIFLGCPLEFCGAKAWDASPGKYATKDDPPFLIIHGADDCEIGPAQAQAFARVLKAAKIDTTLKLYTVLGHSAPTTVDPNEPLAEVDRFLDAKLPPLGRRRNVSH